MLAAEVVKLRRSATWVVVALLPLAVVLMGTTSTVLAGEPLEGRAGWDVLWLRSVVFHGLLPLPVALAVLASLVWRVERRGGAWTALWAGPTSAAGVVAAKSVVVVGLTALMQLVLVGAVQVAGTTVFGLPGVLPVRLVLAAGVVVVAAAPVVVLQVLVSGLLRSFAGPVAWGVLGACTSVAVAAAGLDALDLLLPHPLLARATQLGTGTFGDDGVLTAAVVLPVAAAAAVSALLLGAVGAAVLERRDVAA